MKKNLIMNTSSTCVNDFERSDWWECSLVLLMATDILHFFLFFYFSIFLSSSNSWVSSCSDVYFSALFFISNLSLLFLSICLYSFSHSLWTLWALFFVSPASLYISLLSLDLSAILYFFYTFSPHLTLLSNLWALYFFIFSTIFFEIHLSLLFFTFCSPSTPSHDPLWTLDLCILFKDPWSFVYFSTIFRSLCHSLLFVHLPSPSLNPPLSKPSPLWTLNSINLPFLSFYLFLPFFIFPLHLLPPSRSPSVSPNLWALHVRWVNPPGPPPSRK